MTVLNFWLEILQAALKKVDKIKYYLVKYRRCMHIC